MTIDLDRYHRIGQAGCAAYSNEQLAPVLWAALEDRERLKQEAERLRSYARHLPWCVAGQPCQCGLEEPKP